MRTAITLGIRENGSAELLAGPETPIDDHKRAFKTALASGQSAKLPFVEVQLWTSSGGITKRMKVGKVSRVTTPPAPSRPSKPAKPAKSARSAPAPESGTAEAPQAQGDTVAPPPSSGGADGGGNPPGLAEAAKAAQQHPK